LRKIATSGYIYAGYVLDTAVAKAPAIYAMQDIGPTGPLPPEKSDVALALKAAPTARGPRNF